MRDLSLAWWTALIVALNQKAETTERLSSFRGFIPSHTCVSWRLFIFALLVTRATIVCVDQISNMTGLVTVQVDPRLGGEGTGAPLGLVEAAPGWALVCTFGLVWALYATSAKDLGGGESDDSGMSL